MENIRSYCNYITDFKRINGVSIDMCHNILIFGLVVSSKPERALELGIGRGYVTNSIMSALKYVEEFIVLLPHKTNLLRQLSK